MKRARSRLGENANRQSRLGPAAFELDRAAVLNRDAIEGVSDHFARSRCDLMSAAQLD
jgi:hypothetical protein